MNARTPAPRAGGLVAALAATLVALAACADSGGRFRACAWRGDITGPPSGVEPRRHDVVTVDSAWRERLVGELATFRADTTVHVLLVHKTAVTTDDRDRVTGGGGTIVAESAELNGLQASFAVSTLRTFAPTVPLDRVIDAHLLGADGLPLCER